jgi:hypothetical protein
MFLNIGRISYFEGAWRSHRRPGLLMTLFRSIYVLVGLNFYVAESAIASETLMPYYERVTSIPPFAESIAAAKRSGAVPEIGLNRLYPPT